MGNAIEAERSAMRGLVALLVALSAQLALTVDDVGPALSALNDIGRGRGEKVEPHGVENLLDISADSKSLDGGRASTGKRPSLKAEETNYDLGLKYASEMKKELQEEKKREKSAWDQKTAKAAADADLIKAELAREEGKDAFKEQSVQMRLAVEKVKEQQAEAIREAEAVAEDDGVHPQGLGDS